MLNICTTMEHRPETESWCAEFFRQNVAGAGKVLTVMAFHGNSRTMREPESKACSYVMDRVADEIIKHAVDIAGDFNIN